MRGELLPRRKFAVCGGHELVMRNVRRRAGDRLRGLCSQGKEALH